MSCKASLAARHSSKRAVSVERLGTALSLGNADGKSTPAKVIEEAARWKEAGTCAARLGGRTLSRSLGLNTWGLLGSGGGGMRLSSCRATPRLLKDEMMCNLISACGHASPACYQAS
jgi:hypothetical protein